MRVFVMAVIVAAAIGLVVPGYGQTPYYAGKSIELLVPTAVGGATDILNRFLAPFLEKSLSGSPTIRLRNMPGGGTIRGMNWYAANAKPDGTTVLASTVASKVAYMLQNPAVRYDFRKMRLVAINGSGAVFYASPRTGVRGAADILKAQNVIFGSNTPPGVELPALIAFELFGMSPRVIFGFESRGPIRLAFERGELTTDFQATFVYSSQVLPLIREGKVVPLMTLGFINEQGQMVRDPAVPDLPTVYEVYQQVFGRKPDGQLRWKAFRALVAASWTYGRGLWVPEGTPPEALRALHEGIDRMNQDREFQEQSKKLMEGYPLLRGDKVERQVHRSLSVTLDVAKYIRELMREKYGQSI
ncbi:MAG: Bug family tripartite tricarboxylate transporter substrate binding protein [Armatimonadota bacterium]